MFLICVLFGSGCILSGLVSIGNNLSYLSLFLSLSILHCSLLSNLGTWDVFSLQAQCCVVTFPLQVGHDGSSFRIRLLVMPVTLFSVVGSKYMHAVSPPSPL